MKSNLYELKKAHTKTHYDQNVESKNTKILFQNQQEGSNFLLTKAPQ